MTPFVKISIKKKKTEGRRDETREKILPTP
jgi:hypothetical protein